MAKRATAASARRAGGKPRAKPDFHRQTVLFQWALGKFGVSSLAQFRERFQLSPDSAEGLDERTGLHRFFETIAGALPTVADGNVLPLDRLRSYEQNILEHSASINAARQRHGQPLIDWKYHQYLALLFTEIFLERYFDDADALRVEINQAIDAHNERMIQFHRQNGATTETDWKVDWVNLIDAEGVAREQLARLAFWCATGSGKTLLMHVHVRQFRLYHARAHAAGKAPKLDQIILDHPG